MRCSLVVPIYKSVECVPSLVDACVKIESDLGEKICFIFVDDGSPDNSCSLIEERLKNVRISGKLVRLSRNFGAFQAILAGLSIVETEYAAVMAADLQEHPGLIVDFFRSLLDRECDIAVGVRVSREDPLSDQMFSSIFWGIYCRFVVKQIPKGGVDIFGISRAPLERLISFRETNTSLVGLLMWLGFRVKEFPYARRRRNSGVSSWTFAKKTKYLSDSIFAFSDFPIRLLYFLGFFGILVSVIFSALVVALRLLGIVSVPGYAATTLLISFFGSLNIFGIATIGSYTWRTYENTKSRPRFIIASNRGFN